MYVYVKLILKIYSTEIKRNVLNNLILFRIVIENTFISDVAGH